MFAFLYLISIHLYSRSPPANVEEILDKLGLENSGILRQLDVSLSHTLMRQHIDGLAAIRTCYRYPT
jgi:hypothetical protein